MQNKNKSLVDQLIIEVEYALGTIYDNKSDAWSSNDTEAKLNKTQSDYLGLKIEGPFKPEHYRY